jgi:hypothetical protein
MAATTLAAFRAGTIARTQTAEKIFVPLSGGLDSRLIAACTPANADCRLFTFHNTLTDGETADLAAARKVAAALGREHDVLRLSEATTLATDVDDMVWTRGGQKLVHHCVGGDLLHHPEFDGRLRLNGSPGDVLAGSYPREIGTLNPHRTSEMLDAYYQSYLRHLTPLQALHGVLREDLAQELSSQVERELRRTLAESAGPTAAHQITAWSQTFRQPGFTLISRVNNVTNRADACPHLGYAYCDQMLTLPADWLYQRNFYQYMIHEQLPELREIEYANTGRPLPERMTPYADDSRPTSAVWRAKTKTWLKNPVARWVYKHLPGNAAHATAIPLTPQAAQPVPPGRDFHYDLLHDSVPLLNRLERWLQEDATARDMLDTSGCLVFLHAFRERRLVKGTVGRDRELLGGLMTLCIGQELLG